MVPRSNLTPLALLAALALTQCKGATEPEAAASASLSASAVAPADSAQAELSEVAWDSVSTDPIDLARLGREIGAKRCVAEVLSGGGHGGEALQVLPFTPDAETQLGALCDSLKAATDAQRTERLASIAQCLVRGAADREVVDAHGLERCAVILKSAQKGAEGRDRDYIDSALEQLESRHVGTR